MLPDEDRLRHVIAFFMDEAQTEARARMSLETTNAGLARELSERNEQNRALTQALETVQAEGRGLLQLYVDVKNAYAEAYPLATLTVDEDHLRVRLLSLINLMVKWRGSFVTRCDSCDHVWSSHTTAGCWLTVKHANPGAVMNCPCNVPPRADTEEEDNGDTAGDGRADDASGTVAADGS